MEEKSELDAVNLELSSIANEAEDGWPERVLGWAEARNLIEGSNPTRQLVKLREEVQELEVAVAQNDPHEARDSIGDCCVVLRIIAKQLNLHWDDCLEAAWDEIKNRKGRMVDGIFVKEAG